MPEGIEIVVEKPQRGRPRTRLIKKTAHEVGEHMLALRPVKALDAPITNPELEKRVSHRLEVINTYLDDAEFVGKLASSTLAQIGDYEKVLLGTRQLIKGQPTSIIGHGEQKKLDELGHLLLAELKRRGLSVKLTERKAEVHLDPETKALDVHSTTLSNPD